MRAKANGPGSTSEKAAPSLPQLEALLAQVDDLQDGAFLPISQQPPARAVLLPLAGGGLTILSPLIPWL